jgi:hypothetical protein
MSKQDKLNKLEQRANQLNDPMMSKLCRSGAIENNDGSWYFGDFDTNGAWHKHTIDKNALEQHRKRCNKCKNTRFVILNRPKIDFDTSQYQVTRNIKPLQTS